MIDLMKKDGLGIQRGAQIGGTTLDLAFDQQLLIIDNILSLDTIANVKL